MNIYQRDHTQKPELFTLIREHKNEAVRNYLLQHPADVHLKGWMDDTPLHIAALSGNFEIVELLIQKGADVNSPRSGVFRRPVCWAKTSGIATLLIKNGAILTGEELDLATRNDDVKVIEVLLFAGAPLNTNDPPYLRCRSKEAMDAYVQYGVDINGTDDKGSSLLHSFAWADSPGLFDHAFNLGVAWRRDNSRRTPYDLARQGKRTQMIGHLNKHYPQFTGYTIEVMQELVFDPAELVHFARCSDKESFFIGLNNESELLLFRLEKGSFGLVRRMRINLPSIRSVAVDQEGRVVVPTGSDVFLRLSVPDLLLVDTAPADEDYIQLSFLPARKIFLACSSGWAVAVLDENLQRIHRENVDHGVLGATISEKEDLVALFGYDQDTFHVVYELTDDLKLRELDGFYDQPEVGRHGIAIENTHTFTANGDTLTGNSFVNGQMEVDWSRNVNDFVRDGRWNAVAILSSHVLAAGAANRLFLISRTTGALISEPKVHLKGGIVEIIVDKQSRCLLIRTEKEIATAEIFQV